MSTLDTILSDAARLPVADRLELIEALWNTVPERELPPISDEWRAEIAKRSAEFDAGQVPTVPWSQIKAEAEARLWRQEN